VLVLAELTSSLAWNCSAHSANPAARADPVVIARANQCGSHQYANADNPDLSDHFADGAGTEARFSHPLGEVLRVPAAGSF
jgi:hypothetical protein